ncbi:MAG: transposase, partial [Saccharofermentanales bacterium]
MRRKDRNFHKGGIYHIYQRGNNKAYIFDDPVDKATFVNIIKRTIIKYPCHFLYYVLMDNHYHLVVEMMDIEISHMMHEINRRYSQYYNKKYDRSGTIYGDRFKSNIVPDTTYFLKLLQYIANNPVKAGLVRHPSKYQWSAHMEMVSKQSVLIDKNRLLSYFDISFSSAIKSYMANIESSANEIIEFTDVKGATVAAAAAIDSVVGTKHVSEAMQAKFRKIEPGSIIEGLPGSGLGGYVN